MATLKHISLFSGIGGDTLAAQWAGFETILFVEIDKFCQKVLKKHWPNVVIFQDGKKTGMKLQANFVEWMQGFPIGWTDLEH